MNQSTQNEATARTPGQAIAEAMAEHDISRTELAKLLGSRGRISDLLNDKREPTLREVKILRELLHVSADDLIPPLSSENDETDWTKFPIKEMAKRGWIASDVPRKQAEAKKAILDLAVRAGCADGRMEGAAFRESLASSRHSDPLALRAWLLGTRLLAQRMKAAPYTKRLSQQILTELIHKSTLVDGPVKAQEFLAEHGVRLVINPHFKKMYLDGAVFFMDGSPVIALTLRYDRLDYFWFTLCHEVAHLVLGHVSPDNAKTVMILDDFDAKSQEEIETQANQLATWAAIPEETWSTYPELETGSIADLYLVATALGIHPAIVAGQIRHRRNEYRILTQHVGGKMVKRNFPEAFSEAAS